MTVQKYRKMAQKRTIGNQKLKLGKNQNKKVFKFYFESCQRIKEPKLLNTAEKNRAVQSESMKLGNKQSLTATGLHKDCLSAGIPSFSNNGCL